MYGQEYMAISGNCRAAAVVLIWVALGEVKGHPAASQRAFFADCGTRSTGRAASSTAVCRPVVYDAPLSSSEKLKSRQTTIFSIRTSHCAAVEPNSARRTDELSGSRHCLELLIAAQDC